MPQYFAWSTEYPDEGSLLLDAKDARVARRTARVKLAGGDRAVPLTVVRATERQARTWERNLLGSG